jgi:hypothetical protein
LDWLTFFATDIKSLAWPIAAIVALFLLKGELRGLVLTLGNRLRSFKGFGVETTFAEAVDQVEELLPPPEAEESAASFSASGRLEADAQRIENISELSRLPPTYIVSQAWLRLEQAIREHSDFLLPTNRRLSPITYLQLAKEQGLISEDEEPAIQRLREMRNLAVHSVDPNITITDALRYHDIANIVIEKINQRSQAKPYLDQAHTPTPLRGEEDVKG